MTIAMLAFVAGSIFCGLALSARRFWRMRGTRLVTCPENRATVAVELQATLAAVTGLAGRPTLRLKDCSRWPEKEGCGRECLRQIESAPEGCLVRRILAAWYEDKHCVICGKNVGQADLMQRAPGPLTPEGVTIEWVELEPEKIPEALRTHMPVCFDCHVVSTLRRRFPDLVVDRPWDREALGGKH